RRLGLAHEVMHDRGRRLDVTHLIDRETGPERRVLGIAVERRRRHPYRVAKLSNFGPRQPLRADHLALTRAVTWHRSTGGVPPRERPVLEGPMRGVRPADVVEIR